MHSITANELKRRGVSVVAERLEECDEVTVSVRGREAYVVMTVEKYAALREIELEQAVREARADYEAGRVRSETVDEHIERVLG